MPFFEDVVNKLEVCRKLLFGDFSKRFKDLDVSILWSSLLDPRFGFKSSHWKDDNEKDDAKQLLVNEVQDLAITRMKPSEESNQETQPSSDSEISIGDDDFSFDLHSHSAVVISDSIEQKNLVAEKLKIVVMQEVQSYLMDIENCGDIDPLVWWRDNRLKYPHVALAARKWLSVTATSTPSERVFSICGVVDTAKRSCMVGESIEKQVFLHNNYYKCQALK